MYSQVKAAVRGISAPYNTLEICVAAERVSGSSLIEEKIRDKDGKLTRFLTGRRYVFINVPERPLEKTVDKPESATTMDVTTHTEAEGEEDSAELELELETPHKPDKHSSSAGG
nr:hypothetical protein BaRGS_001996 [Batillaria attramentaria]